MDDHGRFSWGDVRRPVLAAAMTLACASAVGHGQKVTKTEEFVQAMKTVGTSLKAGTKAITSSAYADAKAPLVLARQTLASTVPFWIEEKVGEAAKMTRDAVRKLDDVDTALSVTSVDPAVVAGVVKAMNDACTACHNVYREGNPDTGYKIKQGVLKPLAR